MTNEFLLRPIYADTDAEGVVYYATYLAWMEKGRTELIRQTGVNVAEIKNSGVIFAVRNVNLDYFAPAHYDEELLVQTKVLCVKGACLTFEQAVVLKETGQVLVKGTIILVALDAENFKPTRVPKSMVDMIV